MRKNINIVNCRIDPPHPKFDIRYRGGWVTTRTKKTNSLEAGHLKLKLHTGNNYTQLHTTNTHAHT